MFKKTISVSDKVKLNPKLFDDDSFVEKMSDFRNKVMTVSKIDLFSLRFYLKETGEYSFDIDELEKLKE